MTALSGSLVLIKIGDGTESESFATIGGLRVSQMSINRQPMNASTLESGNWRQLMGNAGIISISMGGSGIFTDAASEEQARANAFSGALANYRFVFANGDLLSGAFQVAGYRRSGDFGAEEIYDLTLESGGPITFIPA